jgi:hypothetical protein
VGMYKSLTEYEYEYEYEYECRNWERGCAVQFVSNFLCIVVTAVYVRWRGSVQQKSLYLQCTVEKGGIFTMFGG